MAMEKRLIDADALLQQIEKSLQKYEGWNNMYVNGRYSGLDIAREMVINADAVDAVEVVRCKDCKHRYSSEYCECRPKDGYCNDGERNDK